MNSPNPSTLSRRHFIGGLGAVAALGALGTSVAATWPDRPVRLIVAFPPGGGVDNSTRIIADQLREELKVPVVIENRPGGSTIVAAQAVLNAPHDGYTFLVGTAVTLYLSTLRSSVPFDPVNDLIPVGPISSEQLVLVTNPRTGIKSFEEMRQRVQQKDEAYAFASYGVGTDAHMLAEQLTKLWGVELLHVPYNGGLPSVQAVVTGETAFTLGPAAPCKQFIEAGSLVPLAVRGHPRSPFFPDVPTLTELGMTGYEHPVWAGVYAPHGAPQAALDGMADALRACALSPAVKTRLNNAFAMPLPMSLEEFKQFARHTAAIDSGMLQEAGVRLDG